MTTDQCRGCAHLEIDEGNSVEFTYCRHHRAWPRNISKCPKAPKHKASADA